MTIIKSKHSRRTILIGGAAALAAPRIVRAGTLPLLGAGTGAVSAGATYVGLGDLCVSLGITEPLHYWGTRAYKSAGIGSTKVLKVGTTDYTAVSGGMLDTAASGGSVSTWYDQVGTNHGIGSGTPTAAFAPTGLGSGKPSINIGGSTNHFALTTGLTQLNPYFILAVAERTGDTATFTAILGANASSPSLLFDNSPNLIALFAGSVTTVACADSAWHSIGALFNGASSHAFVNGTDSGAINPSSNDFSGATTWIGNFNGTGLTGYISEIAMFGYDASASIASFVSNQRNATNGYNF